MTASSNWWGSATGPTAATNPGGTGSAINGAVNYRPWCTVPAPACNATGGVATQLVFSAQPSNSTPNAPFPTQPVVIAKDAAGNVDTSYTGNVTLAIKGGTGTGGAALNGTVTVAAVNGVATFSGLSINLIGAGYQLTASGRHIAGCRKRGVQYHGRHADAAGVQSIAKQFDRRRGVPDPASGRGSGCRRLCGHELQWQRDR